MPVTPIVRNLDPPNNLTADSTLHPPNVQTTSIPNRTQIPEPLNHRLPVNTTTPNINNLNFSPIANQNPPPSLNSTFVPNLHEDHYPFPVNPNTTLVGFPARRDRPPRMFSRSTRRTFPSRYFGSGSQTNRSQYEIDYPIDRVIVDDHISPSIAIKINDAVEYDRFGNAYHTHRYAYQPTTQEISLGNQQRIQRQLIDPRPHRGIRRIREIPIAPVNEPEMFSNYPAPTPIFNPISSNNFLFCSQPICHYTALASPNDPMRIY